MKKLLLALAAASLALTATPAIAQHHHNHHGYHYQYDNHRDYRYWGYHTYPRYDYDNFSLRIYTVPYNYYSSLGYYGPAYQDYRGYWHCYRYGREGILVDRYGFPVRSIYYDRDRVRCRV